MQELGTGYYAFGTIACILVIIGMWGVFKKAGQKGWYAIIPFLNVYILCKAALKENVVLFTILSIIVSPVLIYVYIKLARSFGKGTGYGVLTFFLPFILLPALAFSGASYGEAQ